MRSQLTIGDKVPNFQFDSPWTSSQDFFETSQQQDAIFVFLRYHGCPVCQMEMSNLKRDIDLFNKKKAKVFVFLQSSIDTLTPLLNETDWPFEIVCDPKGEIFQLYAVEPGGVIKYLHPAGLIAAIKAMSQGFMHKKFEGKETQLPATFIINSEKTITFAHYGKTISDVPLPTNIAKKLD